MAQIPPPFAQKRGLNGEYTLITTIWYRQLIDNLEVLRKQQILWAKDQEQAIQLRLQVREQEQEIEALKHYRDLIRDPDSVRLSTEEFLDLTTDSARLLEIYKTRVFACEKESQTDSGSFSEEVVEHLEELKRCTNKLESVIKKSPPRLEVKPFVLEVGQTNAAFEDSD